MSDWGQGAKNNNIGWGQGAANNNIGWGNSHKVSWAGDTEIVGLSFDADYQAVLDRATTLGYTLPTIEQQNLQNTLLLNMKADGVWDKLDVFYNFANNGSVGFATINWKSPSLYLASPTNNPTFTFNVGFTGVGTGFINTNFAPTNGVQYQQNNASRYLYLHTANGTGVLDGLNLLAGNGITRNNTTAQRINGPVVSSFDYSATREMKSIHRTSSTSTTLINGTTSAIRTTAASTVRDIVNQCVLKANTVTGLHTISMYAMGASMDRLEFTKDIDDNWIVGENVLKCDGFSKILDKLKELEVIDYNPKIDE
jgi:hypothetical protein